MSYITESAFNTAFGTVPSTEQKALMSESWEQDSVTAASTKGTIGLFGEPNSDGVAEYYFYFEFTADADDAWWEASL